MMLVVLPLLALGQTNDVADAETRASSEGFAPYQTILDRMPFGPVPPNFNPETPPGSAAAVAAAAGAEEVSRTEEEQQIVSSVRISVLNVTPSGVVAVGFTDSSVQPPVNHYLKVGEKRDVWEVKGADPAEQSVVLVKNGVEVTLKVGEAAEGGKGPRGGALAHGRMMRAAPAAPLAPRSTAMDRLRARRQRTVEDMKAEEARREAAVAEARKDAEKAAAEREQQREALMQIQEELRRQREERLQRAAQEAQNQQQDEAEP